MNSKYAIHQVCELLITKLLLILLFLQISTYASSQTQQSSLNPGEYGPVYEEPGHMGSVGTNWNRTPTGSTPYSVDHVVVQAREGKP